MLIEGTAFLPSKIPNNIRLKLGRNRLITNIIWYNTRVNFSFDMDDTENLKEAVMLRFRLIEDYVKNFTIYLKEETIIFTPV